MTISAVVGLIAVLIFLIYFSYKGAPIVIVAPVGAIILVLFAGGLDAKVMATYTEVYMKGFGNFAKNFFPLFVTGALFAKMMDSVGYTKSIARFVALRLGKGKAIMSVVLAGAILTYGGVSLFVVAFLFFTNAISLFRDAFIPKRLIPGAISLGAFTFTMTALPGTPQVQNTIPMSVFGTDSFAAPGLGIIASILLFGLGYLWLSGRAKKAKAQGEGYGEHQVETAAVDMADGADVPPIYLAILPIVLMFGLNLFLSKVYFPGVSGGYLEDYGTTLASVAGNWSVIIAIVISIVVILLMNIKKLKNIGINTVLKDGVSTTFGPIVNACAIVGFGTVITSLPLYTGLQQLLVGSSQNPLISEALSVNILCGITGSASGGLGAAISGFADTYMQMAASAGISPEVLHRIASLASGGLDTLPFNGAVLTTLALCGMTHKQSYKDICVVSVIIPMCVTVIMVILASLGLQF